MFGNLRGNPLKVMIVLSCALCFSCFGYDQGVLGGVLSDAHFLETFNLVNDANMLSTIVSIYPIGCLIGCILSAIVGLRLGRRYSIMVGCALVFVGGLLQGLANSRGQMIAGRIVAGMGTGFTSSTVPVWLSECMPAATRGRAVCMQLCVVLSGNVTAYWFDYGMIKHHVGAIVWRLPVCFQIVYVFLGGILIFFLPESPRVLYAWKQNDMADSVLQRLLDCDSQDPNFLQDRGAILEAIVKEDYAEKDQSLWRSLFWDTSPLKNSRRLFIGVTIQMLQQMGGCNVVTYYQGVLMSTVGASPATTSLLAGVSALIFFAGTFPPIFLIERLGRRQLLLWGSVVTTLSIALFTAFTKNSPGNTGMGWAAIAMIFLFEFAFACSWNSIVWVYVPEISPLKFRHVNSSLAVGSEWLFTFVTVKITPVGLQNLGWKVYLIFVIFSALQFPFVYFLCPETQGKTLEELDILFSKNTSVVNRSPRLEEAGVSDLDDKKVPL